MATRETLEGSWGIDPVPPRLRVLTGLETGLLWGNLGVSLLVIVAGAVLVPALSLPAGARRDPRSAASSATRCSLSRE